MQRPFIAWSGPWATAMFEHGSEDALDDFDEELAMAWDHSDFDARNYGAIVEQLNSVAATLGLGRVGRNWEMDWADRLPELWPAIKRVAALLLDGQPVTHDVVRAAIDELCEIGG